MISVIASLPGGGFCLTFRLGSAGLELYRVAPEEPCVTLLLIVSGFSLAMGFGWSVFPLTCRDTFPRPKHTEPNPRTQAGVVDRSRGRDGDNRKGRGPARSAGWTP